MMMTSSDDDDYARETMMNEPRPINDDDDVCLCNRTEWDIQYDTVLEALKSSLQP